VVNGTHWANNYYGEQIVFHEGRHNLNSYLIPDNDTSALCKAKDEILAFVKD
jgi:hypothetical protein